MSSIQFKRKKPGSKGGVNPPQPRFMQASTEISNLVSQATSQKPVSIPVTSPPPKAPEPEKPEGAIPLDIFQWMKGEVKVPPARLAMMMADISNKMGYYIAYVIMQRVGNLNSLIEQLHQVEDKLLMRKNYDGLNDAQLFTYHSRLKNTINDFLEFARRFSVESKEIIIDPERDELVNLVRSLDADGLKAIKELLAQVKQARTGSSKAAKKGLSIEDFEGGQGKM